MTTAPPPLEISDAYDFLLAERDRGAVVELLVTDPTGYEAPPSDALHLREFRTPASHRRLSL